MKFTIITHTPHLKDHDQFFAYGPYVREMNIWIKNCDRVTVVAPMLPNQPGLIHSPYVCNDLDFKRVPAFDAIGIISKIKSLLKLPYIFYVIFKAMKQADHIHLRCPGNMGLLGCFVQILFPSKPKTAKYAGNWDSKSRQPISYKLQKWILSNTFLTKNMKVLVYGEWPNQSKNIKPFFTATYHESDKTDVVRRSFNEPVRFVFAGTLSLGKGPLYALRLIDKLQRKGIELHFDLYGEGVERQNLETYIFENKLSEIVTLHGNQNVETVRKALQKAHFLLLPSKSEGWPKVVAEAMFWGCVPIATAVSCVPNMLDSGNRGILLSMHIDSDVDSIIELIQNEPAYFEKAQQAENWSRNYTLDAFEIEIKKNVIVMRILQLIDSLDAGGAERMAVNYANALFSTVKFSALCATRKEGQLKEMISSDVKYLFLEKKKKFDLKAILKLRSFVKENQINIIHAHSTSFFMAVLLKMTLPAVKIVWHDHFGGRSATKNNKNITLKLCSLFFYRVLTINFQNKRWLESFLLNAKISYLPNFISPQINSNALTNLKGQKGKRIVLLANLRNPKNHIQFLKAFYQSSAISRGWSLHFVGKDYQDEYSQEIKHFIDSKKIDQNVFLYGSCIDIQNILTQSDIGVLCSTHEGFPVTLLEYGYSKLAVLSTNVGFCATIIENEKKGLTFSPENTNEIKEKLERILEDENLRFQFSQNLHNEVVNNYTASAVINSYLAFLKK